MDLWGELRRRNVFRVGVAYLLASWAIAQVADLVLESFGAPAWVMQSLLLFMAIGLLVAIVVAWAYELTPEGIKRERDVQRDQSITDQTGKKLNLITIALVLIVAGLLAADHLVPGGSERAMAPAQDTASTEAIAASEPDGALAEELPVVAVLPFLALGSEEGGFLAGGLHDDLLTRLAKLDAFRVISRTSVMEYAGTTKNMREIAEELGANYILEGGVQAIAGRVRINAQLIEAQDDEHIWAETYDRALNAENLFDIQSELAYAIAEQLHSALSPSDRAVIDSVPTQNMEAYSAYLRGLELRDSGGHNARVNSHVIAEFEKATALDPQFALAWAQLSIEYSRLAQAGRDPATMKSAIEAHNRALELRPGLFEAELARVVYMYRVEFEYAQALQALEALEQSRRLDASALMLKAFLLRRLGEYDKAYQAAIEAKQLDPRSHQVAGQLVTMAWETGDCGAAGEHARVALSLAPDSLELRTDVAFAELQCNGDWLAASELMENAELNSPFHRMVAVTAAEAARDWPTVLAVSQYPLPEEGPLTRILGQLTSVGALRQLDREREAKAVLDTVLSELDVLARDQTIAGSYWYAMSRAFLYAFQGDVEATGRWNSEAKRRLVTEYKGDQVMLNSSYRFHAGVLALAGLTAEASEEIRLSLESTGGDRFPLIDSLPVFDALDSEPVFIALRKRFGGNP